MCSVFLELGIDGWILFLIHDCYSYEFCFLGLVLIFGFSSLCFLDRVLEALMTRTIGGRRG
jgi:hypothetical protein